MSLFLLLFLFEVFLFAKTVQVWLLDTLHSTLLKLNRFILKICFVCISFFSKNMCAENHCANNASCQRSSTDKLYQCLCPAGYEGARCQNGKQKKFLYRSSEIFNSNIWKHTSRTLTAWTCVIYFVFPKKRKRKKQRKREWKRDTQRKVNWHAVFFNLILASKIWKIILIVGKWVKI